jgi:glycosyltransferase involved in cell wall biosynthesis
MEAIKVDVLLATKNSELFIEHSINSLLNQTYKNLRLIVIYQDSEDKTWSILRSLSEKDERIVLVKNTEGSGLVSSLNLGLTIATGKYIAKMDSDDIATPNRIENQVRFLESFPEVGVVGSWAKTFGTKEELWMMPENDPEIRVQGLFSSMVLNPTAMIRRDILELDPPVRYRSEFDLGAEDFQFWYELSKRTKFHNLQQGLLFYRLHSNNYSSVKHQENRINTQKILAEKIRELIPSASIDDLAIHFSISEATLSDVQLAKKWFEKLEQINLEKQLFAHDCLVRKLESELQRVTARAHPIVSTKKYIKYGNLRKIYDGFPKPVKNYVKRLLA